MQPVGPLLAFSPFHHLIVLKWRSCVPLRRPKHPKMTNWGPVVRQARPAPARSWIATSFPALPHCPRKTARAPKLAATTHERHGVALATLFTSWKALCLCLARLSHCCAPLWLQPGFLLYNPYHVRSCLESRHVEINIESAHPHVGHSHGP